MCLGTDDAVGGNAVIMKPFHLREDGGYAHASADEDHLAFFQFVEGDMYKFGAASEGTDDVEETVAGLIGGHLAGGLSHGLEDEGYRT